MQRRPGDSVFGHWASIWLTFLHCEATVRRGHYRNRTLRFESSGQARMKAGNMHRHLRINPCSKLFKAYRVLSEHHTATAILAFNKLDQILGGYNETFFIHSNCFCSFQLMPTKLLNVIIFQLFELIKNKEQYRSLCIYYMFKWIFSNYRIQLQNKVINACYSLAFFLPNILTQQNILKTCIGSVHFQWLIIMKDHIYQ